MSLGWVIGKAFLILHMTYFNWVFKEPLSCIYICFWSATYLHQLGHLSVKVLCILYGATKATLLLIKTRSSRENRRKSNKSLIHRRLKAA